VQVSIAIGILWAIAIAVLFFEAKEKSKADSKDTGL
jgi:hypothetical protein